MKKIIGFALSVVIFLIFNVPYLGMLFLLAVVATSISFFFGIGPVAFSGAFLGWSWKIYAIFVAITIFCMTTFSYQHCCVGLNSFKNHMIHYGKRHWENVLTGLIWPVSWVAVDRSLRGWTLCWMDVVFGTIEY